MVDTNERQCIKFKRKTGFTEYQKLEHTRTTNLSKNAHFRKVKR